MPQVEARRSHPRRTVPKMFFGKPLHQGHYFFAGLEEGMGCGLEQRGYAGYGSTLPKLQFFCFFHKTARSVNGNLPIFYSFVGSYCLSAIFEEQTHLITCLPTEAKQCSFREAPMSMEGSETGDGILSGISARPSYEMILRSLPVLAPV